MQEDPGNTNTTNNIDKVHRAPPCACCDPAAAAKTDKGLRRRLERLRGANLCPDEPDRGPRAFSRARPFAPPSSGALAHRRHHPPRRARHPSMATSLTTDIVRPGHVELRVPNCRLPGQEELIPQRAEASGRGLASWWLSVVRAVRYSHPMRRPFVAQSSSVSYEPDNWRVQKVMNMGAVTGGSAFTPQDSGRRSGTRPTPPSKVDRSDALLRKR